MISSGFIAKLSGGNGREYEVAMGRRLGILWGRARNNRFKKTVPQVREERCLRMEVNVWS